MREGDGGHGDIPLPLGSGAHVENRKLKGEQGSLRIFLLRKRRDEDPLKD